MLRKGDTLAVRWVDRLGPSSNKELGTSARTEWGGVRYFLDGQTWNLPRARLVMFIRIRFCQRENCEGVCEQRQDAACAVPDARPDLIIIRGT